MSVRTEVRFNVYSTSTSGVGGGSILPYNIVNFDVGGSYDITTYKYTFLVAGTYLIGISYNKLTSGDDGRVLIKLTRDGTTINIAHSFFKSTVRSTITNRFLYKFEVGDIIYAESNFGAPKMNQYAPTGDNIHNSFWGIRLDWD
jgi:hypothetical protein